MPKNEYMDVLFFWGGADLLNSYDYFIYPPSVFLKLSNTTGLAIKSFIPASLHADLWLSIACALRAIMGSAGWLLFCSHARMDRVAWKPSMPGISQSIKIKSSVLFLT